MIVLTAFSLALSKIDIGDWEENYNAINTCGLPIEIFHIHGKVGLTDRKSAFMGESLELHGVTINGCVYNAMLDSNVSKEMFEEQIVNSGFQIIGKQPATIQPIND